MPDFAALLAARYGTLPAADSPALAVLNGLPDSSASPAGPVLASILNHRSVRQFDKEKPLPEGTLEVLVAAGQSAPSSCNLQTWSVVAVRDPERKSKMALLSGDQNFIRDAPLFLLFVADLHRAAGVAATAGDAAPAPLECLESMEMFLMSSLDAGFAAQNTLVAAEALGLGCCYVGSARCKPLEVAELLGMPPRTVVLFGLAVGYPSAVSSAAVKPRLAVAEMLHLETWDDSNQAKHLSDYDCANKVFNISQNRGHKPSWSMRSTICVAAKEVMEGRDLIRPCLEKRGFELQ